MTEALTVGSGVVTRLIHTSIGPVIPVVDLADKIGYSRSSLTNIITKNPDLFKGFVIYEPLPTPGGSQQFLCVNSTGADRLILLMKPSRNRKEIFERVEAFRSHAFGKIAEQPKPAETQSDELDEVVAYDLKEAKQIAELTGTDPKAMQAAILEKHKYPELAEVLRSQVPALPAPQHDQPGIWMTPTDIGKECALSPRQVNGWLYNHNFQYPQGFVWRLTAKGEAYGEEYEFVSPYKHVETRIRWHRSVLVASGLKRPLDENQTALPARAGSVS